MNQSDSEQFLRRFTESIRRAWLAAVRTVDGDRQRAQFAAERFADEVMRLATRAGQFEARHLKGLFDPTQSADRFRIERGGLVSRFLSDVARASTGVSVGLSARQRRDIRAFAATLEAASLDAIDFNSPAPFTTRESRLQVRRLERAMLQQRARVIGRSEAAAALSLGVEAAVEQTEVVTGNQIRRTWRTAGDEQVRSSHSPMDGQVRAIGEPFITGNGNAMMRPGDPNAPASERANCRCMLITQGG